MVYTAVLASTITVWICTKEDWMGTASEVLAVLPLMVLAIKIMSKKK